MRETGCAPRPRVAIVEDDPIVREHLLDILPRDFDVVGAASTMREGRGLVALAPALFLLDIGLPDGSGLDLTAEIKAA